MIESAYRESIMPRRMHQSARKVSKHTVRIRRHDGRAKARSARPAAAHRQRGIGGVGNSAVFYAQEKWHEPIGREAIELIAEAPGDGYVHPVTLDEIRDRIEQLPARFRQEMEVVQLSRMTRKRALFPCYGMQWGPNVYLYPIEESLVETYVRPPKPEQIVEARMYGAEWKQDGNLWRLQWTPSTIKDFYLNNVLIHEIGHVNDHRNRNFDARERYANWFAIEYGYRPGRNRV